MAEDEAPESSLVFTVRLALEAMPDRLVAEAWGKAPFSVYWADDALVLMVDRSSNLPMVVWSADDAAAVLRDLLDLPYDGTWVSEEPGVPQVTGDGLVALAVGLRSNLRTVLGGGGS